MLGVTDNGTCLQIASPSQQLGQCNCKAGVFGRKCDQCVPGKWGFVQPPVGTCFGKDLIMRLIYFFSFFYSFNFIVSFSQARF